MTLTAAKPRKKPLHEQVAATLWTNILSPLQPGDKLASEAQLARNLGVSVLTLRQALSVLAHEGMIERRHGSGTYVADHRRQKGVAVGTVAYPQAPLSNPFQTRLFMLLSEAFKREGYHCRSYVSPLGFAPGWAELIEDVRYGRIAGAAFVAMDAESLEIPFTQTKVPYVGGTSPYATVELDTNHLVRTGLHHLIEHGCRRIAFFSGGEASTQFSGPFTDLFHRAMADAGLTLHPEWMRTNVSVSGGEPGRQFLQAWNSRSEKPDGLLVTDDVVFHDIALALWAARIDVPGQLQIATHANKGSGLTYPFPVNLLEVDVDLWCRELVKQLINLMNHEPVGPAVHHLLARLIPAGSQSTEPTAAIPATPIYS